MKLKTYAFSTFLSLSMGTLYAQNVGIGTSTPNTSAKMDITATDRGVLIPRVTLSMTTVAAPVTSPANSLLVYNTVTAGDVTPGFYYWSSTANAWIRLAEGKAGWEITGNNGITAANFLGTINAADLNIHTSGLQRMVVASGGNVGIGDGTPAALFTVGAGDLFQVVNTGHARGIFGTAALPSFSFVGDTDNGMYRSAVNELSFSTAATQRAVISATGLVGINAATPATYLDVNGDLAYREGTALALANGANATVAPGASSHVRITGPTAAFSIAGFTGGVNGKILTIINTTTQQMTILNNGAVTATNGIYAPNAANLVLDGQYASVTMQYNSTLGRWVVLSYSKQEGTDWLLTGNTGINDPAVPVTYGTSTIAANENWMGTRDANDIVWGTNNIERLRLKQTTGYLGLGTSAPAARMEIYDNTTVPVPHLLLRENGNDYARLTYMNTNTNTKFWTNSAILSAATDANSNWNVYYDNGAGTNIFSVTGNNRAGVMVNQVPNTTFDINGDVAWREGTAVALANGANNNIAPGATSYVRITGPTAAFSVSGVTGGVNGKIMTIVNTTTQTMTIPHNDAASTAANRIYTPAATALSIEGQYASVTLQYNSTLSRWVVTSYTDGTLQVATGNGLSFGTAAPVLNEVILGGTLEQATTVDQGAFAMNWDLTGTGDFNILDAGTTYFSFRDNGSFLHTHASTSSSVINLTSTGDFVVQDNGSSVFEVNDALEAVFNEASLDYDFRVESNNRNNAVWLDASSDILFVGYDTGNGAAPTATDDGLTVAGSVVDYVVDFDQGSAIWDGTAVGIGSIEYLLDGVAETTINNAFSPTTHITDDLGYSTTARGWDDVYADDFVNISDGRLKKNIQDLPYGLKEIMALRPVSYILTDDPFQESKLGLIAQDLLPLVKEAVKTHDYKIINETTRVHERVEFERMGVKYNQLIPVLINAIQEQQTQIDTLKKEIETLKNK